MGSSPVAEIFSINDLQITYKASLRLHIFDKAFNHTFHRKPESPEYNAVFAITGTTIGTATEKIYQELGIKSFQSWRWFRKLSLFYEMLKL